MSPTTRKGGPRRSLSVPGVMVGSGESLRNESGKTKIPRLAPSSKISTIQHAIPLTQSHMVQDFLQWIRRLVDPEPSTSAPTAPTRVSVLALLRYATPSERIYMTIGFLVAALAGLAMPCWLIILSSALDTFGQIAAILTAPGEGNNDSEVYNLLYDQLVNLVIAFAVLGAFSLVTGFAYVAIFVSTGQRQVLRIRQQFVQACFQQDATWYDRNNRNELPTIVATSFLNITDALGRTLADLVANAVSALGCLIVALLLNAPLSLVMLLVVPIVAICVAIVGCYLRSSSTQRRVHQAAAGALATEAIAGRKTVAALCAEEWALTKYTQHVEMGRDKAIYGGTLTGLMAGLTGMLFYMAYCMAFMVGTKQVASGMKISVIIGCLVSGETNCRVTGASVIVCIYGVILCATYFNLMTPGIAAINLGREAAAKIYSTIDRVPEVDTSSSAGSVLDALEGEIEFRNVLFVYPTRPKNPILTQFNMKIKAGSSVAFCGPSGCGKSTIAKMLLYFYEPTAGQVLIDGNPLSSLNVTWWRSQVGYVAQAPVLFPGTIYSNIACGKPGATKEEVIAAAKAACAHEFILDLPGGYDMYYSGTSTQLSGGQLQRISIARALIRNPAVLILDEFSSALDSASEQAVQAALANIRKLKRITTVTIAHRLSTIVDSDVIAVISDGGLAEQGSHKELLELGGIYASLCESQGITRETVFAPLSLPVETKASTGTSITLGNVDIEHGLSNGDSMETFAKDEALADPAYDSKRLWDLNKPEWGYIAAGVIGAVGIGALPACESILAARIVANFYVARADEMVAANREQVLYFLAFAAASLVCNLVSGYAFSKAGCSITCRVRCLTFEAILRRPMGWLDVPEHSVGELTSRLEADSETISKVTGWALFYQVRVYASLTTGVVIALSFSWQIGLAAIACVPLILGASLVQKYCDKPSADDSLGMSPENIFEQGLRGIEAVQAYDLQGKWTEDYNTALSRSTSPSSRQGVVSGLVYGLSQFAIFGCFAIVFFVGTILLVNMQVNFIEFFTPILAIIFGALGVSQTNADFNAQREGLAAARRAFDIIDAPLDNSDPFSDEGTRPAELKGEIKFESITFCYPARPDAPVYYPHGSSDGFSLSILPQESVAFVGKSGCGKSTALQLLLRFYDANEGKVLLDGRNVQELNVKWLRSQIGYVGQMPVLFAGTFRDNILLGNPKATEDEIIAATKAANAYEFIMKMANGLDTDIGVGGSLLSGGQRQRVAIARALVSDPKLLVLDEVTAALDNASEKVVQKALDELQRHKPRTTLVVAHRLSTVRQCDKIAVLGGGSVCELGSHAELIGKHGLYADLWRKQGGSDDA